MPKVSRGKLLIGYDFGYGYGSGSGSGSGYGTGWGGGYGYGSNKFPIFKVLECLK